MSFDLFWLQGFAACDRKSYNKELQHQILNIILCNVTWASLEVNRQQISLRPEHVVNTQQIRITELLTSTSSGEAELLDSLGQSAPLMNQVKSSRSVSTLKPLQSLLRRLTLLSLHTQAALLSPSVSQCGPSVWSGALHQESLVIMERNSSWLTGKGEEEVCPLILMLSYTLNVTLQHYCGDEYRSLDKTMDFWEMIISNVEVISEADEGKY